LTRESNGTGTQISAHHWRQDVADWTAWTRRSHSFIMTACNARPRLFTIQPASHDNFFDSTASRCSACPQNERASRSQIHRNVRYSAVTLGREGGGVRVRVTQTRPVTIITDQRPVMSYDSVLMVQSQPVICVPGNGSQALPTSVLLVVLRFSIP